MWSKVLVWTLAWGALASGCGRYGYDTVGGAIGDDDAGGDAPGDGSLDGGLDTTPPPVAPCDEPFSAPQRVDALSRAGVDDWAPFVSADDLSIYFASWRSGASDLFVARRSHPGNAFGTPALLGGVNSAGYETAPALTPDGHAIYFIGPSAEDIAVFDVFVARRGSANGSFGAPHREDALSSSAHETAVEIARDGLSAYVVSNRGGGTGGRDIWRATRAGLDDEFGPLAPLDEINSRSDEGSLTLSADGLEIIFASNRPGGAGGLDLWHARRASVDDKFGAPSRLAELASTHDDSRPSLSADARTIYFNYSANEEGGDDADIWVATRCMP